MWRKKQKMGCGPFFLISAGIIERYIMDDGLNAQSLTPGPLPKGEDEGESRRNSLSRIT